MKPITFYALRINNELYHIYIYIIYLYPNNFTCKYLLQQGIGPVEGLWFLKHYKYWTHLRYPVVA